MSDFGSFEWAKQVVANANAEREVLLAMSQPTEGSPSLMEHAPRSRERAALDIAVRDLVALERGLKDDYPRTAVVIRETLDKIAALVPEAVK